MARREADREDLLREATALVERVELQIPGWPEPIVCGFRRDGAISFFFGADPVYQFNTSGQLRRAFLQGRIHKAENGHLVALTRERTATEVSLVRHECTRAEEEAILNDARSTLTRLHTALTTGTFTISGQVPPNANITPRIEHWLSTLPPVLPIATRPNVE